VAAILWLSLPVFKKKLRGSASAVFAFSQVRQGQPFFFVIPFLNQAFTSSNALRRSSPYSLYCFVAARFSPRVHLDLEMELFQGECPWLKMN
jgi:hypothetical protein